MKIYPKICLCSILIVLQAGIAQQRTNLPEDYALDRNLVYSVVDGKELLLDVYYMPESDHSMPLVISIHGGGWKQGSKAGGGWGKNLIGKGYAVAAINYRLSQEAIFPAQIIDCKSAIRYLRAHAKKYKLDPARFGVWGGSAGGHLAALVGTSERIDEWDQGEFLGYSSRVQAVVDFYGPTNFLTMNDIKGNMDHNKATSPESRLIGGPIQENPKKVRAANPITYVAPHNPPFLMIHGKEDMSVPCNQSEILYQALTDAGVEAELVLADSNGHGLKNYRHKAIPMAHAFFDKHLLNTDHKAAPQATTQDRDHLWVRRYFKLPKSVQYKQFRATSIQKNYGYMLYLPPSYKHSPGRRFPVVYVFPDDSGDPITCTTFVNHYHKAINNNKAPEAIIVGINSGLPVQDLNQDDVLLLQTLILEDLVPHIDRSYRTAPLKKMRILTGLPKKEFGTLKKQFNIHKHHKNEAFKYYRKVFGETLKDRALEGNMAHKRMAPTLKNIPYGPFERNTLDLYQPDSKKPTPLIMFMHGGAFKHGSKEAVHIHEVNELVKAGITVAAINYRLTPQDSLPAAFHDGKRALQFLRYHADKYNIDKKQVAVFGGSAGAQMAMWIGFHKDMKNRRSDDPIEKESTRVKFIGSKGGQITMDQHWWIKHIPGYHPEEARAHMFNHPGRSAQEALYLVEDYAAKTHISKDDPPIYMHYYMAPEDRVPINQSAVGTWQAHHVVFGVKLKEIADKLGVENVLNYTGHPNPEYESFADFAKKKFGLE